MQQQTTKEHPMDWKTHLAEANQNLDNFRATQPAAAKGFSAMHMASIPQGVLSRKHKELIALAIGIHAQCVDCIGFHVKSAIAAGATRDEIAETISVCMMMGGGPAYMYGVKALEAYDQLSN